MLNLSDKELDRLSREAAQEHDPGDVLGPRSWEKLEPRLDADPGKFGSNPMRAVRRLPFYYASAVLLLLGVTAYFVRQNSKTHQGSGSPPDAADVIRQGQTVTPAPTTATPEARSTTTSPSSTKIDPHKANSTPGHSSTVEYPSDAQQETSLSPDKSVATSGSKPAAAAAGATVNSVGRTGDNDLTAAAGMRAASGYSRNHRSGSGRARHHGSFQNGRNGVNEGVDANVKAGSTTGHPDPARAEGTVTDGAVAEGTVADGGVNAGANGGVNAGSAAGKAQGSGITGVTGTAKTYGQDRSIVQRPRSLKTAPSISDSALRASAKTTPVELIKKKPGLRINRKLQFGLMLAPDFSSVNSMAGDRAGSTWGITVDYQFANHWYIGTGLLFSRKNYAARAQDYHVPSDYYRMNNIKNVDFVKGSFNMLEIPLNLRYDFSVSGNTLFFASAGVSSYLRTNENCNYYFDFFGREACRSFQYPDHNNYLFSAINLSLGVETGISNSLSILVAPYVKLPSRNLGFGQVDMNSFGINFALKFAPVISRKRR
jgi:hypothetical protein